MEALKDNVCLESKPANSHDRIIVKFDPVTGFGTSSYFSHIKKGDLFVIVGARMTKLNECLKALSDATPYQVSHLGITRYTLRNGSVVTTIPHSSKTES